MHSKLLSWLSIFGLLAAFTLDAAAQQAPGKIIAARVTGDVTMTIKATQATAPIKALEVIQEGSIVTTKAGASIVLLLANGASVNLGTDSVLDIEQFTMEQSGIDPNFKAATATDEPSVSHTRIRLNHGELVGKVAHLKKDQGSEFTVSTPVGAAGIRGTTFQIVFRPNGTGQAFFSLVTAEGVVELSGTPSVNGTVPPPVNVSDSNQVALTVTVTVNDATGVMTVTMPNGGTTVIVPTTAPASTTAQIQANALQIAQAVANIVIPVQTPQDSAPATTSKPPSTL